MTIAKYILHTWVPALALAAGTVCLLAAQDISTPSSDATVTAPRTQTSAAQTQTTPDNQATGAQPAAPSDQTGQAAPQSSEPAAQNGASTAQTGAPAEPAPTNAPQASAPPPRRPPPQEPGLPVFRANVREVMLHATVLDDKDRSVRGLPREAFQVYENNVLQHINYFAHEDAPVSVGILIDNSGSMRDKRGEVNRASINFVKASNPHDEVFIVNFNDEYYLDADFTSDVNKLQEGLDRIESRGGTALYDAMIASLDHLAHSAKQDKKVLLVVTDGADNSSRYTLEQTVRLAQAERGPIIYCIGILNQDDSRSERRHAEKALKELATATGGIAYFPKDLGQVDYITRQVAADIRDQYTLTYRSNQTTPGFRAIRLVATAPHMKHLSVRTRTGYYGSENTQPAAAPGQ